MFIFLASLAFLFILSFIFFTHEFGHFLMSKIFGVKVLEFGFGFPPRAFGIKKGETIYSLNFIPFGAFVKILGEEGKSEDKRALCNQPLFCRFLVASAGILSNFFWAWLILTISFWIYYFLPVKNFVLIQEVLANSPASAVSLKPGDILLSADGVDFKKAEEVSQFTKAHQGEEVRLLISRFGRKIEKKVKLTTGERPLGISMFETAGEEKVPILKAPLASAFFLGQGIYISFVYLIKMILGRVPFELGGPVAVYGIVKQFSAMGFLYLFRLAAILSLALGFFNFLPLPAIDGGKMAFLTLERIFGKKIVRQETENLIHGLGFVLLILLSILIFYRDLLRLLER